ncbi:MAG: hypothetical protein ACRCU6_09410, partial [Fusobacteriaceae bacterium]
MGNDPQIGYALEADRLSRLEALSKPLNVDQPAQISFPKPKVDYSFDDIVNKRTPEFNVEEAFFSDDPKKRKLAQNYLDKKLADDKAVQLGINVPNIYAYDKSQDKFLDEQFGYDPTKSIAENEDFYYQNEYMADGWKMRSLKNIRKGLVRVVGGAATKLVEGFGYLGSMVNPVNWDNKFWEKV